MRGSVCSTRRAAGGADRLYLSAATGPNVSRCETDGGPGSSPDVGTECGQSRREPGTSHRGVPGGSGDGCCIAGGCSNRRRLAGGGCASAGDCCIDGRAIAESGCGKLAGGRRKSGGRRDAAPGATPTGGGGC
jgi:hypothetical protein